MTLRDTDEQFHEPPLPLPVSWQENLFFICWNTANADGIMMHIQRVPGRAVQEARVIAAIGGSIASATLTGPYVLEQTVEGVEVEVGLPFRDLAVRATFDGVAGTGPFGFVAAHPAGDVPVRVDLRLRSELPPVDFAEGLAHVTALLRADAAAPQMGDQAHYEQGGTWMGTIAIGERTVDGSGLFVRDHSWGIRHEHNDFTAFWTATCLDDGHVFCNAIGMPTSDGYAGIGAIADANGVRFTHTVAAVYSPAPGLCSYDHCEVRYGEGIDLVVRGDVQAHWPMYLPFSGRDRYDNNALASVEADGHLGFSVMEWATTLDPDRTAVLDDAATRRVTAAGERSD